MDLSQLGDQLLKALGALWAGKTTLGTLGKPLFTTPPEKDLLPCHTRIIRLGRALPLAERAAMHCTKAGQVEFTAVQLQPRMGRKVKR